MMIDMTDLAAASQSADWGLPGGLLLLLVGCALVFGAVRGEAGGHRAVGVTVGVLVLALGCGGLAWGAGGLRAMDTTPSYGVRLTRATGALGVSCDDTGVSAGADPAGFVNASRDGDFTCRWARDGRIETGKLLKRGWKVTLAAQDGTILSGDEKDYARLGGRTLDDAASSVYGVDSIYCGPKGPSGSDGWFTGLHDCTWIRNGRAGNGTLASDGESFALYDNNGTEIPRTS